MTDRKDLRMIRETVSPLPDVSPLTFASERLEGLLSELRSVHAELAVRLKDLVDETVVEHDQVEKADDVPRPRGESPVVKYLNRHGDGLTDEIRTVRGLLDTLEV